MATVEADVEFGERYRDRATGFTGIAVGVWTKWLGQVQVSLARIGQDGKPYETWFDRDRLERAQGESNGGEHL